MSSSCSNETRMRLSMLMNYVRCASHCMSIELVHSSFESDLKRLKFCIDFGNF